LKKFATDSNGISGVVALALAGPALPPCANAGAEIDSRPAANSITTDNLVRIVTLLGLPRRSASRAGG
jgi:hypothetical protein